MVVYVINYLNMQNKKKKHNPSNVRQLIKKRVNVLINYY